MTITLITDLGTQDATTAACRALLMRSVPDAVVVDLSANVPRHDVARAAYLLEASYSSFPQGTVHIASVGALVGKGNHRLLYGFFGGHHFLAPDNGLLPAALQSAEELKWLACRQYERTPLFMEWMSDVAAVCRRLDEGAELSYPGCEPVMHPDLYTPQKSAIGIACKPLCSDRYGNMVLNIREDKFREMVDGRSFSIRTFRGGNITDLSTHYNDVPEGKPLCRFNSSGYLEIAVNHGSALELFGIDPADSSALAYHTVRISLQ